MNELSIPFLPVEDMTPQWAVSQLSETEDWGLIMTGVPEAHKRTRGAGVTVAVLDTGRPNHLDLNDNLLPAINCSSMDNADDKQGHGTHVAGIVAALINGIGVVGVAPEAKVLPIKVLNDNGTSGFAQIEAGIRAAIAAKVDIINMSLGTPFAPPDSLYSAIKEAHDQGIILVAAAGNDSGAVNYPARFDEVIAVAAIDSNGQMARFSSHGDQIRIGAPGVNIYSTYLNNAYAILNGTSQASPFLAGVCALLLAWTRANPAIPQIRTAQDMLAELDLLADPLGRVGVTGKDGALGFGIPRFANFFG